ncbi:hypothetical protein BP6252_04069 [Coleophoma cylindrospora]|uniref:Uncharacterized protein n=1 Tax=Coleophoma cylindrospora TaxID=1849047 RepID=A0A3D8S032_9HELO|nr:hypothetical protein BP6252_04069 [Coleophoma cylindrospora]
MATVRPRNPNLPPRPMSENFSQHARDSSMFFSLLPSAVKSRIPRIPSIRRSVSMYAMASRRRITRSGSSTPDTGYTSAMVLSGGSRALMPTGEEAMSEYYIEGMSSEEDVPRGPRNKRQSVELTESKSGIAWKYANQGLNLLSLACEESSTISQNPDMGNASFARQLYVHAITYFLRALPTDLTTEEQLSIRSALPEGVVEPLNISMNAGSGYIQGASGRNEPEPSLLHKTLAATIIQLFLFFQFVLPYFRLFITSAYQYDRTHKISERLFSQGIETVDSLGKGGLTLTSAIYNMGDGKVGQVINDTAAWLIDGVSGGIHDGVGEGLVIMGARKPASGAVDRR